MAESHSTARFPTTCWSHVTRAGDPDDPEAVAALEELGRDDWYPLFAYARRRGLGPDYVSDLVQKFLANSLKRRSLQGAYPDRGRFRSFVRAACGHYLAYRRDGER